MSKPIDPLLLQTKIDIENWLYVGVSEDGLCYSDDLVIDGWAEAAAPSEEVVEEDGTVLLSKLIERQERDQRPRPGEACA